jgi:hypothetical protein
MEINRSITTQTITIIILMKITNIKIEMSLTIRTISRDIIINMLKIIINGIIILINSLTGIIIVMGHSRGILYLTSSRDSSVIYSHLS